MSASCTLGFSKQTNKDIRKCSRGNNIKKSHGNFVTPTVFFNGDTWKQPNGEWWYVVPRIKPSTFKLKSSDADRLASSMITNRSSCTCGVTFPRRPKDKTIITVYWRKPISIVLRVEGRGYPQVLLMQRRQKLGICWILIQIVWLLRKSHTNRTEKLEFGH